VDAGELLTTAQAAELTDVTEATVRSWKHRGQLAPAGLDERGRPLYRLLDVARAEHATRHRAGRRHPAAA
jgi:DNA-binding transcriptional MerR regulator